MKSPSELILFSDSYNKSSDEEAGKGIWAFQPTAQASTLYQTSLHHNGRGTAGYPDGHADSPGKNDLAQKGFTGAMIDGVFTTL